MVVPNNESKVCEAVVRTLEKRTRATRTDVRHPERDGVGPPVDLRLKLGVQEYAIEHTRIESFENQIGTDIIADRIVRHIRQRIPDPFPSPAYYELQFPTDVSLPKGKAKRDRALNDLVKRILASEQVLRKRSSDRSLSVRNLRGANDLIQVAQAGFCCKFELLHWPIASLIRRPPGTLSFRFIPPDDPQGLRTDRLRRAFSQKFPKLKACKAEGARTVLVLESGDSGPVSFEFRSDLLPSLLARCMNAPDEIFLVETCFDLWWLWPLKRDDVNWSDTGMPELNGNYYDPDRSGLSGMPEWLEAIPQRIRDALQLDSLYAPSLPGWAPATFKKDELGDLTTE